MGNVVFNVEAIKELMNAENLSLRGFAKKLGLSPACISRIMNKKRKYPSGEVISAFKKAYPQYSLDYYFVYSVDKECHKNTGK